MAIGVGDNLKKDHPYYPLSDSDMQIKIAYDASGNVEYVGYALPGIAVSAEGWQIKKFTYTSGNITACQYAGGSNIFDKIWNSYAGYSYS